MTKAIAILQSNYIPWKGYFDIIASVDEFVIFDDVQYTRRDWRNRNLIVQNGRLTWLTIPVVSKGAYDAPINSIAIADRGWARRHWESIKHAYGRTAFFGEIAELIEPAYAEAADLALLTEVNELFLRTLCRILSIETTLSRSDEVSRKADDATGRLLEICADRQASTYVSGPAARSYIDREAFAKAGVTLKYANYGDYPVYKQGLEPFQHGVSMLDPLFRLGPEARSQLKTVRGFPPFLDDAD